MPSAGISTSASARIDSAAVYSRLRYHRPPSRTAVSGSVPASASSDSVSSVDRSSSTFSRIHAPIGSASPSIEPRMAALIWRLTMSSTLVSLTSTDSSSTMKSTPPTSERLASSLRTSSRRSSPTRSVTGPRNVSRSPGSRTSIMPRTSSSSIAASIARPASSGVAAPPAAPSPVNSLMANTPAPMIATAPTAAAMTLPRERPPGAGAVSVVRATSGGGAGGGWLAPGSRGLPNAAVAHDPCLRRPPRGGEPTGGLGRSPGVLLLCPTCASPSLVRMD